MYLLDIYDIIKQLEDGSNIYSIIEHVKALIKTVEADLTTSERVYLNTLNSILDSVMTMDISECRLKLVKALLGVILLYIVSRDSNDM